LIGAREAGVSFERTATLGRQNLFVGPHEIDALCRDYGMNLGAVSKSEYADDFFRTLGAKVYVPIDASAYEGAVEVHDMNDPIPVPLRGAFDTVVDGGTLEHVFNFPTAIKNCMELVRVGGHVLLQTPTNNYCGHGFYQFSPELYFRVFSPENGFRLQRMIAHEAYPHSQWYEVSDPAEVGARVELIGSDHRVLLLIRAQRIEETTIFGKPPQQSDYSVAWAGKSTAIAKRNPDFGIRKEPGLMRRLGWKALRLFDRDRQRAFQDRRVRFSNRQLGIGAQEGVFRSTDK
jgi:hypothetical protein